MAISYEKKGVIAGAIFIVLIIILLNYSIFKEKFTEVITIVVLAYVMYFAASGILEEFSGFGIKLKLRKLSIYSKDEVIISPTITVDKEKVNVAEKGPRNALRTHILPKMMEKRYTTLSIMRGTIIDRSVLIEYLRSLLRFPFFKHVILVNTEKFKGHIFAETLLRLIDYSDNYSNYQYDDINKRGDIIVNMINQWQLEEIQDVVTESVKVGTSYYEALRKMNEIKSDYLPIVDNAGKFVGIITSKEILNELYK